MADIVVASGCSPGTIYRHFKGKDELILAAVEVAMQDFRQKLAPMLRERADCPLSLLDAIGPEWTDANLIRLTVMAFAEAQLNDRVRRSIEEHCTVMFEAQTTPSGSGPLLAVVLGRLIQSAIVEPTSERNSSA